MLELFGTSRCPHTEEMRDWLERRHCAFMEYDVETNPDACRRMREISGGARNVPLLAEDGKVVQIGWQGRSCIVDLQP
jgi:glutaredoxin